MEEVTAHYRRLISIWHPDRCCDDTETCEEMTRKINAAYETIQKYCRGYRFSFAEASVKQQATPEEWWIDRFGEDPMWGCASKTR